MKVPLIAIVLVVSGSAHAERLTLEGAIQLAMTRNERVAIADLDVEIAEADVASARTLFLPVVDASGSVQYRPRNDPSTGAQGQLAITQPIFNPSAFPLHAQAKHALAGQRALRIDERRRIAFDSASAFVAVLLAEQVVQAAQRKHDTAVINLAATDAQVKAQLVSSNDVTRAQINMSTATRDLEASKGNLRASVLELELLINTRVTEALAAPTALLAAGRGALAAEDGLVEKGITRRADLLANRELARAAHDFAREPRMRYLPAIELGGQLTAASGAGPTFDALVAISARWTLWDSGQRAADTKARGARARIADLQTTQLARTIDAEIRTAAVLLASRQQALAAAAAARDAARKGAEEAAILYRQGLAKAIELVDANDQRFIAEVNFATSEFDVARAYLSLRLAMGQEPVEMGTP